MLTIVKTLADPTVDFAAEELKKYLRMMMPRSGDVKILFDPEAETGFRLGLLSHFALSEEGVRDPFYDDVIEIQTDKTGGILAGSNPRSVLLAVYQFLRQNGCRWLFPGIDGEYIPIREIEKTSYRHVADHRIRAQCNEGSESQASVLETIDFTPKIGMNTYMLEFDIPMVYYKRYYSHDGNAAREPEPVTADQVLQWKRASEAEMAKRGLIEFDMGHGWTTMSLGISSLNGWDKSVQPPIPEESRPFLAMLDGKRDLCRGVAINTQICMSNPLARKKFVDCVVDYAKTAENVGVLKISLADWQKNHCECDECRKMRPSDWYVVLLNEIDEAFTREGIPMRLGFSMYSDTSWEPEQTAFKNPARFLSSLAPISRNYLTSAPKNPVPEKLTPYIRNVSSRFETLEEYVYRAHEWKKISGAEQFVYEYHFWKEQVYNPSPLTLSRRVYEDVFAYRENGFIGMMEDCSQRHFFPNALAFTVYGNTLFDLSSDYEKTVEDYGTHAYGAAWEVAKRFFEEIEENFPHELVETRHSKPVDLPHYHDPARVPGLQKAIALCEKLEEDLKPYSNMPYRVQTVSVRLLRHYAAYLRGIAGAFILKSQKKDEEAKAFFNDFLSEFGKREIEIERYYDQSLVHTALDPIFKAIAEPDM